MSPQITDTQLFDQAVVHQQKGELNNAEQIYVALLQKNPKYADAAHMLGVIFYQRGNLAKAMTQIQYAMSLVAPNTGMLMNFGVVLAAMKDHAAAICVFNQALEFDPRSGLVLNNLGISLHALDKFKEAESCLRQAVECAPNYADAHISLATILQRNGDTQGAIKHYERGLELNPTHSATKHLLASLKGETTAQAPTDHVKSLFDGYAENFDEQLTEKLGYSMPVLLREQLLTLFPEEPHFSHAIDLGCGTGLNGIEFKPFTDFLVGVDLSPQILEKARLRSLYDELDCAELTDHLLGNDRHYDFFICADVFPYIGDLEPLFATICHRALPEAIFAFSTERAESGDYKLRPTGRYAHSERYLESLANKFNFKTHVLKTENLRKHRDNWIRGDLVILQLNKATELS